MGMGEKSWYLNRENFCKELIIKSIFEDDFFFFFCSFVTWTTLSYLLLISCLVFSPLYPHLVCMDLICCLVFSPFYPSCLYDLIWCLVFTIVSSSCLYDVVLFYWFCKEFSFFLWELLTLIIHISIIWHKFQMFFL